MSTQNTGDRRRLAAVGSDSDSDEESVLADDYMSFHMKHHVLTNTIIVIAYFALGVLYLMLSSDSDWHFSTALYEITQIITTIGYGDLTITTAVKNPDGTTKLEYISMFFMIIYLFLGIAIVANIFSTVVDYVIALEKNLFKSQVHMVRSALHDAAAEDGAAGAQSHPGPPPAFKFAPGGWRLVIAAFLLFLVGINAWALFFSSFEACTCGYGKYKDGTRPNCIDKDIASGKFNYTLCEATGGRTMEYTQGLYMAVVTFSTVGFGDFTPMTRVGRMVAIPGMFMGVGTFALLISSLSAWFHSLGKHKKKKNTKCKKAWFQKMDFNGDGVIRRNEFRLFYLLKDGTINMDMLDEIDHLFDSMDINKSNELTQDEITNVLDA